jgi:hypothetical protein
LDPHRNAKKGLSDKHGEQTVWRKLELHVIFPEPKWGET